MVPHAVESSRHRTWFIPQPFAKGHFLCLHGLEVLVDHGSTDVQDWRGEQLGHKGRFYNNSEELVQKCADGEVGTVVPEDPLSHAEFPMSISKVGPQGVQPNAPCYKLQQSTGLYRHRASPSIYSPPLGHRSLMCSLR